MLFQGKFLWPGFGENSRVLEWILRRIDGDESIAKTTPIGIVPQKDSLNLNGLKEKIDQEKLFSLSKTFWLNEVSINYYYYYFKINTTKIFFINN